ncbi:MAG: DUF3593 domain-containing protein [Bacteroidales bacterium]|nr:DUF3593 domain-containing protein [Bacteroidales bacterium]
MADTIQFWATVASPIVGVIAIIVALFISNSTSKKIQKQVNAVYDLLDVFVAAQNPIIIEAKRKYEQQLRELDTLISEAEERLQITNPFLYQCARIDMIMDLQNKNEIRKDIKELQRKRKKVQESLNMIQSYIEKTRK